MDFNGYSGYNSGYIEYVSNSTFTVDSILLIMVYLEVYSEMFDLFVWLETGERLFVAVDVYRFTVTHTHQT